MKFTITQLLKNQLRKAPPLERADLTGKNVLVVGANVGLGLEASKHFASMSPARLILACRSKDKGEDALQGVCDVWAVYVSVMGRPVVDLFIDSYRNTPTNWVRGRRA